jgi:hypothetical protein
MDDIFNVAVAHQQNLWKLTAPVELILSQCAEDLQFDADPLGSQLPEVTDDNLSNGQADDGRCSCFGPSPVWPVLEQVVTTVHIGDSIRRIHTASELQRHHSGSPIQ